MASIDIAIPNYQYGRHLRACVESVLSQDVARMRVRIIDNASTDDSVEVAQELVAADPRVTLARHRTNLGHQASFNEALDWAEADYFMILCADDILTPGSLARAIQILETHPDVTLAFGELAACMPNDVTSVSDIGRTEWQLMPAFELLEQFCRTGVFTVRSCSAVVRTAVQKRAGYYCPALDQADDFELVMRLTMQGGRVARTRTPQLYMRAHDQARSAVIRRDRRVQVSAFEDAFAWFFAHDGAAHPDARRLARLARRSLVGRAYWSGLSHLCRGDVANARGLLRYVLARSWPTALLPPLDYLLRMERPRQRTTDVAIATARRWLAAPRT